MLLLTAFTSAAWNPSFCQIAFLSVIGKKSMQFPSPLIHFTATRLEQKAISSRSSFCSARTELPFLSSMHEIDACERANQWIHFAGRARFLRGRWCLRLRLRDQLGCKWLRTRLANDRWLAERKSRMQIRRAGAHVSNSSGHVANAGGSGGVRLAANEIWRRTAGWRIVSPLS